MENINQNEMIIEYVGDRVRQQIADLRERRYDQSGVGSSYLFRIDEFTVIDATKKGGLGRFLNHSCNPNCYIAKWVVGRQMRMGIFTKRDIGKGEELTFNYNVDRYGYVAFITTSQPVAEAK